MSKPATVQTPVSDLMEGDYLWISNSLWRIQQKQNLGSQVRLFLLFAEQGMWPGTRSEVIQVGADRKLPMRKKAAHQDTLESIWWGLLSDRD